MNLYSCGAWLVLNLYGNMMTYCLITNCCNSFILKTEEQTYDVVLLFLIRLDANCMKWMVLMEILFQLNVNIRNIYHYWVFHTMEKLRVSNKQKSTHTIITIFLKIWIEHKFQFKTSLLRSTNWQVLQIVCYLNEFFHGIWEYIYPH